jgi:hydroxypyruvate reductase
MAGDLLVEVWRAAVAACDPRRLVREACATLQLPVPTRVVAVGTAAGAMAAGAADVFGSSIVDGVVVTVDGAPVPETVTDGEWRVRRAGHPVPDQRSYDAAQEVMAVARGVGLGETMLVLLSGGASALLIAPRTGLDWQMKAFVIVQEMRRGVPIAELNRARTERSEIKGGKLAAMCPGKVVTLVISDVPGDDVSVVGSGPTVPGKPGDVVHLVAGMARFRREAATALATMSSLGVEERDAVLEGDIDAVANEVAGVARRLGQGRAWVAGGEWTVTVGEAAGRGGRATHLALLVARAIAGTRDTRVLVAGSDGVDGTGPWSGAIIDGETWSRAGAVGGARGLAAWDSGRVLDGIGAVLTCGPTGVNHADLIIVARE